MQIKNNVSILVPHKNSIEQLKRLLNSIPADIKIIVVDDNSDINVRREIEDMRHTYPNATFMENTTNSYNAGVARNIALSNCESDWVIFADADDEFVTKNLNEFIEKVICDDFDMIFFGVDSIDESTSYSTDKCKPYKVRVKKFPENERTIAFGWEVPWGRAIKRKFLEINNIWFESRSASNDVEFSARLAVLKPRLSVFEKTTYIHYESSSSLSGYLTPEKALDRLEASMNRNNMFFKSGSLVRLDYNYQYLVASFPCLVKRKKFYLLLRYIRSFSQAVLFNLIKNRYLFK